MLTDVQICYRLVNFCTRKDESLNSTYEKNIVPEVIAKSSPSNFYCIYSYSFSFKCKPRQCRERASNCLPHNEHPFSYFTCVIALFGWSCHHVLLFRCTNMRNVGESNQDAKIMTCYVHKHMLYVVDVPQTNFKST